MINDITTIQVLLSAVFVFIGIVVFYISSLISGHNIYKDVDFQKAFMISIIIGFILFLFLPIGFIVLLPELFGDITPWSNATDIAISIHKNIIENAFLPFIMAAAGLGIVIGCFTLMKARWEMLIWLRKKTGLGFYILSYEYAWDHFFIRLKRHSVVAIQLGNDSWVKGHLLNFSVRTEPKQIILENYDISPSICDGQKLHIWLEGTLPKNNHAPQQLPYPGQIMITDADVVKKIAIHGNALKKHAHEITHAAQSFYWLLSSFGFVLLLGSVHWTYDFLQNNTKFKYLASFYEYAIIIFAILTIFTLVLGFFLIAKDYQSWESACILNPPIPFIAIIVMTCLFANPILIHYICTVPNEPQDWSGVWLNLSAIGCTGSVLAFVYWFAQIFLPANAIKSTFKNMYKRNKYIGSIAEYLHDEINLNNTDHNEEYDRLTKLLKEEFSINSWRYNHCGIKVSDIAIGEFIDQINNLAKTHLKNQGQISLIIKLYSYCSLWKED